MGHTLGFEVEAIDAVQLDGIDVSSTNIRKAILEGEVCRAISFSAGPIT